MKSSVSIPKSTLEYTMKEGFNGLYLKIRPELKIENFLITILQIFCDSVIQSFLNFRFR